jgi:2-dehydropantoate 2-reductase
MFAAMHEVIAVAQTEGVGLTEADFEACVGVLRTLAGDGLPSMRQDALAHRKSEVELFAGTIIRLARKHGVAVPVNQRYYERILAMEAQY